MMLVRSCFALSMKKLVIWLVFCLGQSIASSAYAVPAQTHWNYKSLNSGWSSGWQHRLHDTRQQQSSNTSIVVPANGKASIFLRWHEIHPVQSLHERLGKILTGQGEHEFKIILRVHPHNADGSVQQDGLQFSESGKCLFENGSEGHLDCLDRFYWTAWIQQGSQREISKSSDESSSELTNFTHVVRLTPGSYALRLSLVTGSETIREWDYPLSIGGVPAHTTSIKRPDAPRIQAPTRLPVPAVATAITTIPDSGRYIGVEEFRASDGTWFSHANIARLEKTDLGAEEFLYRFRPQAIAFEDSVAAPVAMAFNKGVNGLRIVRNTRTRRLTLLNGQSPLIDRANAMLDRSPRGKNTGRNMWDTTLPVHGVQSGSPASESVGVRFHEQTLKHNGKELRFVTYQSQPFSYTLPGGEKVSHSLRGFTLFDAAHTATYFTGFAYQGNVILADGSKQQFAGQRINYLVGHDSSHPIVDPGGLVQLRDELASYQRIVNRQQSRSGTERVLRLSPWQQSVYGVSMTAEVLAAVEAEQDTNPVILVVFGVVTSTDALVTLIQNFRYDLARVETGEISASEINPFDGEVDGFLEGYHEWLTRVTHAKLEQLGLVDPEKIEAFVEVGTKGLNLFASAGALAVGLSEKVILPIEGVKLIIESLHTADDIYEMFVTLKPSGKSRPDGTIDLAGIWHYLYQLDNCPDARGEWNFTAGGNHIVNISQKGEIQKFKQGLLSRRCVLDKQDITGPVGTNLPRYATMVELEAEFDQAYAWCKFTDPSVPSFQPNRIEIQLNKTSTLVLER